MKEVEFEETLIVYDYDDKVVFVNKSDSSTIVILGFAFILLLAFEQFLYASIVFPFLIYNILYRDNTEFNFQDSQLNSFSSILHLKYNNRSPFSLHGIKKIKVYGRYKYPDKETSGNIGNASPYRYVFTLFVDDVITFPLLSADLLSTVNKIYDLLVSKGLKAELEIDESEIADSKYG